MCSTDDILILVRGSSLHSEISVGIAERPLAFNQDVKALTVKSNLLPRYLLYYLLGHKTELLSMVESTGIGAGKLDTKLLKDFPVRVPSLKEQLCMVQVLSAFDEKIELNRQTARTLEELAQRLFKSWFVDFDPVRAKMAGRQPAHMPPETAAMFSDSFVETALGPVPQGWDVAELGDVIDINPRETLKKEKESLYLEMAALPTAGMSIEGAYMRPFKSGTKFRKGDTLMARITPCLENGKAALFLHDHGDSPAWGSTEFIVLRPKGAIPTLFPYLLVRDPSFREYSIQNMTGTSGRQRVSAQSIAAYQFPSPPASVLEAFGEMVDGFGVRIEQLRKESQTLSDLRDRLLPKLISGEIRVPETQEIAKEA